MSRRKRFWTWCLFGDVLVLAGWPGRPVWFYILTGIIVAEVASWIAGD